MGERSQIFVKINHVSKNGDAATKLFAFYYSWCFNERMISRVRSIAGWLKENVEYIGLPDKQEKLKLIANVNFDMGDVVLTQDIIKEAIRGNDYQMIANDMVFNGNDNNHGQAFIEVDRVDRTNETKVMYCFREQGETFPMNAEEYLMWDNACRLDDDDNDYDSLPKKFYANLPKILCIRSLDDMADIIPAFCENMKSLRDECALMTKERLISFLSFDYREQFRAAQEETILDDLFFYRRKALENAGDFAERKAGELETILNSFRHETSDIPG